MSPLMADIYPMTTDSGSHQHHDTHLSVYLYHVLHSSKSPTVYIRFYDYDSDRISPTPYAWDVQTASIANTCVRRPLPDNINCFLDLMNKV